MMNPEVLLLDEITSALDPELVGDVLDVVAELAAGGMTLLIVTHEMMFAAEVANEVVFIDQGNIVEQGEPNRIFSRPETNRLRAFLARLHRHRVPGIAGL